RCSTSPMLRGRPARTRSAAATCRSRSSPTPTATCGCSRRSAVTKREKRRPVMELPADVRALFEAPNHAHLATVLPGGGPHTVPLWAGSEDGKIAFLTPPGSRKARNLAADPRVAISVIDNAQPHARAQVRGRVTARLGDEEAW